MCSKPTVRLIEPDSYKRADQSQKNKTCNGCGSKGFGWFVPNRIWGLDIAEACNIHDWMYSRGRIKADKDAADVIFRYNVEILIEAAGGPKWLQKLRLIRANTYYQAVARMGDAAFFTEEKDNGRR